MTEILRFNAGNDTNGNPRRIFAEIASGQVSRVWDEGYEGHHAVPPNLRTAAANCTTLPITPKGYRDLLKLQTFSG
jgi:hypothetical protein